MKDFSFIAKVGNGYSVAGLSVSLASPEIWLKILAALSVIVLNLTLAVIAILKYRQKHKDDE